MTPTTKTTTMTTELTPNVIFKSFKRSPYSEDAEDPVQSKMETTCFKIPTHRQGTSTMLKGVNHTRLTSNEKDEKGVSCQTHEIGHTGA